MSTQQAQTPPQHSSVDADEIAKFSRMAADWWDVRGKFRPLHQFNPVRLAFIRETVIDHFALDAHAAKPFANLRFLDIGCGGGLLCEPMCRLGAKMVGVDAARANIEAASLHAKAQNLAIDYRHNTAEALVAEGEAPFDVVLNMEVIEHTADPAAYLHSCAKLVRPGGLMIIATINRTPKARLFALTIAERVLRWLPPGTHDYDKLVRPEEIRNPLTDVGFAVNGPFGVSFNPLSQSWSRSNDVQINYMMVATRPEEN